MFGKGADTFIHLFETNAISVKHGTTKIGREAIAIDVDDVDIAGALGNAFFQNFGSLVH